LWADKIGVADSAYKRSSAASLRIIPVSLSPLFIAEPPFSSLHLDRRGASAIRRAGLRNLRLLFLHRERTNKVFGKRLHATARDLLTSSTLLIPARAIYQYV
jgi:hypothetical protein